MEIVLWPDALLATKCDPVDLADPGLADIVEQMYGLMKEKRGVGLAANQVGLNKRILILDIGEGLEVFLNPELVSHKGLRVPMPEGCLSVPDFFVKVERYKEITVRFDKPIEGSFLSDPKERISGYIPGYEQTFTGYRAHVLQHEIEHLNGKIFVEHLSRALRHAAKIHMQRHGGTPFKPSAKLASVLAIAEALKLK